MGCDIHAYKEKRVNGVWVTADVWEKPEWSDDENEREVPWEKRFTDRNYKLFGMLSNGVRSTHSFAFEPRGVPFDVCSEVREKVDYWDGDGHSHSYLYLRELRDLREYLATTKITITGMKHRDELVKLRETMASDEPDWALLYPYCAATTRPDHDAFEVQVPALVPVGDSLDALISSFDEIDGESHRIVFWFDN